MTDETYIIQRVNPETEAVTVLAEFQLRGDGVHATYHNPGIRRSMERDGIWTVEDGRLKPSDGQKFLDALPRYYARSSTVRVLCRDAGGGEGGGSERKDDDAHEWTPPPGGGRVVQGKTGPAHDEGNGLYGRHGTSGGPTEPTPPKSYDREMPGEPKMVEHTIGKEDEWSDEARAAALEARQAKAKGPEEKAGDEHRAEAKEHAAKAQEHAKVLRRAAKEHPEAEGPAAAAEEHAAGAREAAGRAQRAPTPDLAEHHARAAQAHAVKAEHEHEKLKKHAEEKAKEPGEHEKHLQHAREGWKALLHILVGKPKG